MRVPDSMIVASITARLSSASERLFRTQEKVSSGLAFSRPSQNPSGAVRAAALRASIAEVTQYLANADSAAARFRLTESSVQSISQLLTEARTAGLSMTDASADGNAALAEQVHQIAAQIVRNANSSNEGSYLFSGYKVLTPPLIANGAGIPPYLYQGDRGDVQVQIGRGVTITGNIDAAELLNLNGAADPGHDDVLEILRKLEAALRAGDHDGVAAALTGLERDSQRVLGLRGQLGARVQHVEMAKKQLDYVKLTFQDLLSQVQDADLTQAVIDLRSQELTYQAAAAAAFALHRASLLDYLR
jgi:flagellar hook-associated protein 3 FlgL